MARHALPATRPPRRRQDIARGSRFRVRFFHRVPALGVLLLLTVPGSNALALTGHTSHTAPPSGGRSAAVPGSQDRAMAVPAPPTAPAAAPVAAAPTAAAPADTVTALTPTTGYLANPSIGYQGWTYAKGALPQSTEYRRGDHPEQGGFDWATLNPAQGRYNWRPIDDFLASVAARGQQGSFRVMTMNGEGWGTNFVPQWVKDAGAIIRDTVDLEPDYRSRAYQENWGRFVDALAARFDGDPRIAFIDISGYGRYNEWQANPFTDQTDTVGENDTLDSATRRNLVHMFVGGSGTSRVLESDSTSEGQLPYSHPGFQHTQLVMPYAGIWASTRYVLRHYPHVGFRNDALFSADATLAALKKIGYGITDLWRSAPVIFETIDGADPGAVAGAQETMRGLGASLLHDNGAVADAGTLARLATPLGYRYVADEVRTPSAVAAGGQFVVETSWTNTGTARAYPRMGQDFGVSIALADASGRIVGSWADGAAVSDWLPGERHVTSDTVRAPAAGGTYTVLVGVADRDSGSRIQLPLRTDRTDEWYPAGSITVR